MNNLSSPIFITGHPKSGTTLLTTILDSHPQLMVLPEESDFYRLIKPAINELNKSDISIEDKKRIFAKKIFIKSQLRNFLSGKTETHINGNYDYTDFDAERFKNLILEKVSWNSIDPKSVMLSIIESYEKVIYTNNHSFKYWVEKTPHHIFFLKEIKHDFPHSKIIFIYRDPRDNYISYLRKKKYLAPTTFSYQWNKCFKNAENTSNILFIKYEELVKNPDEQIDRLANFLNIEKTESLFHPSKKGVRWTGNSMFGVKMDSIDSSNLYRYKTLIKSEDQKIIEILCRKNMLKYKYPLDFKLSLTFAIQAYIKDFSYKSKILLKHSKVKILK